MFVEKGRGGAVQKRAFLADISTNPQPPDFNEKIE